MCHSDGKVERHGSTTLNYDHAGKERVDMIVGSLCVVSFDCLLFSGMWLQSENLMVEGEW